MKDGLGKKPWVVPVLEKIEMVDTACQNMMGKNMIAAEHGNCGSGPGS